MKKWIEEWLRRLVYEEISKRWDWMQIDHDLEQLSETINERRADLHELKRQINLNCERAETQVRNRLGQILAEQDAIRGRAAAINEKSREQEFVQKLNDPGWLLARLRVLYEEAKKP